MRTIRVFVAAACVVGLAGCGTYHKVTATSTGQTYYTRNLDESPSGSMKFTDAKTGEMVVLPSATVQRVSKQEFDRGTGK
jgi:hypothetical protein